MPGPSRTRHPARLALPCGVQARLGEASSGFQKRARPSAAFSSESDTPSSASSLRKKKSKFAVAPYLVKQMKSLMNLMGSKSKKSNIQSDSSESGASSEDDAPKNDLAAQSLCFMCKKRQCSQILSCKHVYCEPCIKKQKASKKVCIRCGLKFRSWEPLYIG
ncbi:uncharacterized protein LOC127750491 [Frankliniella occidentalis]|uniref:Uncharacterized protein LOC127750491 n=1 Tax=Frankliniella occidentalis TaxID=133901 RepID=A0A9C6X323_FRAOC|nr:uncharacterized protein LOC127750491 [Frankliniella occidentalis]